MFNFFVSESPFLILIDSKDYQSWQLTYQLYYLVAPHISSAKVAPLKMDSNVLKPDALGIKHQ